MPIIKEIYVRAATIVEQYNMRSYLGHYVIKFTYGTTFNDFNREKYVNRSNNRCILCIYGGVVVCKKIMSFTQYFPYKSARVCCCFYIVNKMQRAHSIVMSWNTLFNFCKMYFLRNVIGKAVLRIKVFKNR